MFSALLICLRVLKMHRRRLQRVLHTSEGEIRGTKRLFSVKHLFGEAKIAWNFLSLKEEFLDDRSIHSFIQSFIPYDVFLRFKFLYSTPRIELFFTEKGNLKFSDLKMRWKEESEKFSLS